jgi:hypothetical protein
MRSTRSNPQQRVTAMARPKSPTPVDARRQPANTALLNSLWGREKIKFGPLRETKDLAAISRETKTGRSPSLNPNCNPGPSAPATPLRADQSIFLIPNGFDSVLLQAAFEPAIGPKPMLLATWTIHRLTGHFAVPQCRRVPVKRGISVTPSVVC